LFFFKSCHNLSFIINIFKVENIYIKTDKNMGFRTKLDFSDNRQVKQRIETTTVLSGATTFGVPYNQLPTGPNYQLSAITLTIPPSSATTGTFSGNNTTTVFTWPISELYLADDSFSAITPSNSAITQTSDYFYSADTSTLFSNDGYTGYTSYTGIGFTMFATSMVDLGGGSYSGTVNFTDVNYVQAPGLDFTGRTIWADVSGITRTDRLIISDNAYIGKVFMCNSSEGMGKWETLSGLTATTALWTNDGVGGGAIRSTNGVTHTITGNSDYSIIAGGASNAIYDSDVSFIGGASGSFVSGSSLGFILTSDSSEVRNSNYGGIIGGQANLLYDSGQSIIAGGTGHQIDTFSTWSSIVGGRFGEIHDSDWSSVVGVNSGYISGGSHNGIYSTQGVSITGSSFSTVFGGRFAKIYDSTKSSIFGGEINSIYDSNISSIVAGSANTISYGLYSGIFAGKNNEINVDSSGAYGWGVLIGGENNYVDGLSNYFSVIGGGNNIISDSNAAILVSESSQITGSLDYSAILVGTNNEMTTTLYTGPANTIMAGGNNNLYRNSGIFGFNNSVMLGGQNMIINGTTNFNSMITSYQSAMSGTVSLNTIMASDNCKINTGTESIIIGSEQSNLRNVYQSMLLGTYQSNITGSSTVTSSFIIGGEKHTIVGPTNTADYSSIINGSTNTIRNTRNAMILGGSNVTISGNSDQSVAILAKDSYIDGASINSGLYNTELSLITNSSAASTITGGYINRILSSNYSSVLGGIQNVISGSSSFYNSIIGGLNNRLFGTTLGTSIISSLQSKIYPSQYSVILGGYQNIISGLTYSTEYNTILGGSSNVISGNSLANSSILGGVNNIINTTRSAIVGGSGNTITKNTDELTTPINSGIFAGANNKIIPRFGSGSVIMSASYCAIVGGESNTISGHSHSFIGGGFNNLIECDAAYNAIVAGQNNINHAFNGVIIGGQNNTLGFSTSCPSQAENSIILGGSFHKISEFSNNTWNTAIIGGTSNLIDNTVGDVNNTVILGGSNITATTSDYVYVPSLNIKTVGSSAFANDIRIIGALDTIKQLNGVNYQWVDRKAGGDDVKLGFIAQQVEIVEPKLVFTNKVDGYKGLHVDGIIPLLVEAVKELSSGSTTINNSYLETQTILAEDNNIDLNYNGSKETSIGGGLRVLHAKGQDLSAELITDENGNFVTNNDFKPNALTIPYYTPSSSNDTAGSEGNITRDDNYMYVKTSTGWKRTNLESF